MNLWETLRILRRRWPILAIIGLLTVGGVAVALRAVSPAYESRTTLLLVMPAKGDGTTAAAINPYLNFGSTLVVTGKVMSEAMTQDSVVEKLRDAGARADYTIEPDPWDQSPTLTLTVSDPDPVQVATTLVAVAEATRQELSTRQQAAGAPPESWIAAVDVTGPEKPVVLRGNQVRAVVFVIAAGMILALMLAFAAEGWQRRRVVRWADAARADNADLSGGHLSRKP